MIRKLSIASGALATLFLFSFFRSEDPYVKRYYEKIDGYAASLDSFANYIITIDVHTESGKKLIVDRIHELRKEMKAIDIWLRYMAPARYRKVNGQLPVEYEVEPFEKYERPMWRYGSGLSLAEIYLEEEDMQRDSLYKLIRTSADTMQVYKADSIVKLLKTPDHFLFANRLFLLNLAAVYTNGFECPDTELIIPELTWMMGEVNYLYALFNSTYPTRRLTDNYLKLYEKAIDFARRQPVDYSRFDHFTFIRDYINPLFEINQDLLRKYQARSSSVCDMTINEEAESIFEKPLFEGQQAMGIYWPVKDKKILQEIREIGRTLFYDPILSGNLERSCASCHKPTEFFSDTSVKTNTTFDKQRSLPRNTISLTNVIYNHLAMHDGRHVTLLLQLNDVTSHKDEMSSHSFEILTRVMSCPEYRDAFTRFASYTTQKKVNLDHVFSSIIYYYSGFSYSYSPFDDAMNERKPLSAEVKNGFNLFMSKARCGMCHYVPVFNGVKPPFIDTEFEVLGTPEDSGFHALSPDPGRFGAFPEPADEMRFAFRTPTLKNIAHTKPYMHNGVFHSLEEVVDFYDAGGGLGHGLEVETQTLPPDSLHLTGVEKAELIAFMNSLTERIVVDSKPLRLPASTDTTLNKRIPGEPY